MNNKILPLDIINDQSNASVLTDEKTNYTVRLWTDEDFRRTRKKERFKKSVLLSLGWGLIIIFGILFERRMLTGWNIVFGGVMLTIGWYLVVIRGFFSSYMPTSNKVSISKWWCAAQPPDWFRELLCSICGVPVKVNIRYHEYVCDQCCRMNRTIDAGGNSGIELRCKFCEHVHGIESKPICFVCPYCKTMVTQDFVSVSS